MPSPSTAAVFAVALNMREGTHVPTQIELVPAGTVVGRDGRTWLNDRPDDVIAAFNAAKVDLPIDLEHATELRAPKGEPAPAQGWIKELLNVAGAICARVEWTDDGAKLIGTKAYRYISPAFLHARDGTQRVLRLVSAGLTNTPNLDIPALNSQQSKPENVMDKLLLTTTLGIAATSSDADIVTALNSLKAKAEAPDATKFVPKADLDAALNRAKTAEDKLTAAANADREAKAVALVDQAVKDGKVAPASKDHYLAMCRKEGGYEQMEALFKTLPKLTGATNLDHKNPEDNAGDKALNASQRAAARALGIKEEDYLKTLQTEKDEQAAQSAA